MSIMSNAVFLALLSCRYRNPSMSLYISTGLPSSSSSKCILCLSANIISPAVIQDGANPTSRRLPYSLMNLGNSSQVSHRCSSPSAIYKSHRLLSLRNGHLLSSVSVNVHPPSESGTITLFNLFPKSPFTFL